MPLNVVFGLAAAWAIAKFEFRGKALADHADRSAVFRFAGGRGLDVCACCSVCRDFLAAGSTRMTSRSFLLCPGIVLATLFVTFPFVARELIPVMQATGTEQEQAALTLGASGWQTFWHVTLPSVKWGLLYGVILCNARAMGEFGAVRSCPGISPARPRRCRCGWKSSTTSTTPRRAFAVASLLALLALLTLGIKTFLEWKQERAKLWPSAQQSAGSVRVGQLIPHCPQAKRYRA